MRRPQGKGPNGSFYRVAVEFDPSQMPIVVIGAGIAGTSAAYQLAVKHGRRDVILVDEREPLTLTSDKGTQGYRNWWPGPDDTMLRFVSRSIDLLEEFADESANAFRLNRRGYLFATADPAAVARLRSAAADVSAFGMGDVREHSRPGSYEPASADGYRDQPTGADLLLDGETVRAFPFLTDRTVAALHVRRAGYMDAVMLGRWLLERATGAGARLIRDRVTAIDTTGGRVRGVVLASGARIDADQVVIAAGPELPTILDMVGTTLPITWELHAKVTMRDPRTAIPRAAPFTIWMDPVTLTWTDAERAKLAADPATRRLLDPFPGGVHGRPVDGRHGDEVFLIWTYDSHPGPYVWPPTFDPTYADVCLRGMADMVPGMAAYAGQARHAITDGGYYCKTPENRPLIGPLGVEGAYVLGALSGFGIMAAHAGAELVAAHVLGAALPDYAKWFSPSRYESAEYRALVEKWGAGTGQL
jgi:glycine/D-amino acid oxidase-like deaminating enzyme